MSEAVHPVRVRSICWEAKDVYSFVLTSLDGSALPAFEAGAHVDVLLPNGLRRSYSLSNDPAAGVYRITVARDPNSAGGSAFLAERLRPGEIVQVSAPRNNFHLAKDAPFSVFIAGGIGITPFLAMLRRLNEVHAPWRLHYCVRTRDRAAMLVELEALAQAGRGEIVLNFDHEPGGVVLDLEATIAAVGGRDHLYCCGPSGMLDAFRAACRAHDVAEERVHFEYFKGEVHAADEGEFDLVLAKTNRTVRVGHGRTILEALLAAGLDVPYSCSQGVCGACETRVLAGTPDHRDLILSEEERAVGDKMMICCSGSKTASLTLDL